MGKLVSNGVVKPYFSHCQLIRVFSSQTSDNFINRIHEISLRGVYDDTGGTFYELLQHNESASINCKIIQIITTEVYEVVN